MSVIKPGIVLMVLSAASLGLAADWPQWRGPNRDGITPDGPALADAWPKEGPRLLWKSTTLPAQSGSGTRSGGCGSVAVAGGRAYVYVSWKHDTPIPQRLLTTAMLTRLGWNADLPDDLAGRIEAARLADQRAGLKGADLNAYVKYFVETQTFPPPAAVPSGGVGVSPANTAPAPGSTPAPNPVPQKFANYAKDRLMAGYRTVPWKDLVKLAAIRDKTFETPEPFEKALAEMGLADDTKKQVLALVPTVTSAFTDTFVCLDADTGKEVWRQEFPGMGYDYAASGTPTVNGDRVYAAGSNGKVYCLSAKDGSVVWQAAAKSKGRVSSSFLLVDKAAILMGGELTAYDADTGALLWSQKKVRATENSAVLWTNGGKKYLICNTPSNAYCVEPEKGDILWQVLGGLYSTATVSGDWMVIYSGKNLAAYKLAPDKAEPVWKKDWTDRGASVIIHNGCVYAVGGRIACVDLASGDVKWEAKAGGEIASPVLADGKIICAIDNGAATILFRATPEKYDLLGKAKLTQAICTTPAVVDGRMYLRLDQAVGCYDLTAPKP